MTDTTIISWANRLIKTGFYLLFGLVPLLLTPWNYELFEYNKMMLVYVVTAVIVVSWIAKSIAHKKITLSRTPLDIPILIFVASQLVSTVFSIDPHVSWLGYYSRFNGGMWSVFCYAALYFAFVSNYKDLEADRKPPSSALPAHPSKKQTSEKIASYDFLARLLVVGLTTGVVVAIYGVLERMGIDKHIWVQDVQNRVFSTLGQPNWLAAYIVALLPVSMALMVKAHWHKLWSMPTILWAGVSTLFFVVLLFTRSRSGLVAFAAADVLFWGLTYVSSDAVRKLKLVKLGVVLHLIFFGIITVNGTSIPQLDRYITISGLQNAKSEPVKTSAPATYTAPLLEVGGTESGTIRKYVWQGALSAWQDSAKTVAIGTGTETFAFAFYQFRPTEHNLTSEWDFLYNKAHNEYLNFLATTGVFGLSTYVLFLFTTLWLWVRFAKQHMHKSTKYTAESGFAHLPIIYGLGAGWTSVLITNFFGFSVVVVQLVLFLFPAFLVVLTSDSRQTLTRPIPWFATHWSKIWIMIILGCALVYVIARIASFWYADTLFASGYHHARSGLADRAVALLSDASKINSNEPLYHDELSGAYAALAVAAYENQNATQAAALSKLALSESDVALHASPNNVNFWKTRTKVFYTLSSLDPSLNAQAIDALNNARKLSPNDAKIYYNLAILTGRGGDATTAIEYLQTAKKLKPNYRDAYFALNVFYTELQKTKEAKEILEEYLTKVDPNDADFQTRVATP